MRHAKPTFGPFVVWGACSRCGARVKHSTLRRERLTGLLMCTGASGRPTRPCLDPWPQVYDFQAKPDRSIEPPRDPLPARWMLDGIFSASTYNSVAANTPAAYANAPKAAPDDVTRLAAFMSMHFQSQSSVDFASYAASLNANQNIAQAVTVQPASYDGTFIPSTTIRTTPPSEAAELLDVQTEASTGNVIAAPPWAVRKGI